MQNVLIINAHQVYPGFSEGTLNQSFADRAMSYFAAQQKETRYVHLQDYMEQPFDIEQQLALHEWADLILIQMPVNWMGVPWLFKKYMDEVYTAGMGGELCNGDGRSRQAPQAQYGSGGTQTSTRYMLSLTFNAPKEAFDDKDQYLFEGKSVDDLFFPMHMNLRFFGMTALPTFASFDVLKNPNIQSDLERFDAHLKAFA
ncbi:Modulator of drug activity [Saliniradius amylolyticus]|uniref:Modulator of drug activity n=1 Tax=Saliniradius amylolyticus TaxID=2183582 RepID=A0A2S2E0J6_9ALTE|nr:NAD(P)H-dependent oxidoreductase [Saliniradius amylolyticus]AWL11175.1 Modulator of drug activity [Saliniradius amylolyticus]